MPDPVHQQPAMPGKGTKGLGDISKMPPSAKLQAGAPLTGAQDHGAHGEKPGGFKRVTTGKGG
jgi:hypothetical protein